MDDKDTFEAIGRLVLELSRECQMHRKGQWGFERYLAFYDEYDTSVVLESLIDDWTPEGILRALKDINQRRLAAVRR